MKAFTIVELLVVIVVLAILAAIAIVSYSGIQNRVADSVVQSDINQAHRKLRALQVTEEVPVQSGEWNRFVEEDVQSFSDTIGVTSSGYKDVEYPLIAVYNKGYWEETGEKNWQSGPLMRYVEAPFYDMAGVSKSGKVFMSTRDTSGVVRNFTDWDGYIDMLEEELSDVRSYLDSSWIEEESEEYVEYLNGVAGRLEDSISNSKESQRKGEDLWLFSDDGVCHGMVETVFGRLYNSGILVYVKELSGWTNNFDPPGVPVPCY